MKKITCLVIMCLVYIQVNAQKIASAIQQNGKLNIKNGRIVNQYGEPPQLKGISFSWSIWQGAKYYDPAVVNWLCSDFKVSVIRIAMAVEPEHGYLQQPQEQEKLIIPVIDQAIKNGIYVLIDWHDHHANLHTAEAKKFFSVMAHRYHRYPNVLYEIWNEPELVSWDTVKNYALQIIPAIRQYDRDNLIIVGSPHWDQDVDMAAGNPILQNNHVAYSFHFYASDPGHQEQLRARCNLAIKKGLPILITEWGVGEADGGGKFDREKTREWMDWMRQNKLSWVNWNLTDKDETTAILLHGASVKGNWSLTQLTNAGLYIRDALYNGK